MFELELTEDQYFNILTMASLEMPLDEFEEWIKESSEGYPQSEHIAGLNNLLVLLEKEEAYEHCHLIADLLKNYKEEEEENNTPNPKDN